MSATQTTNNQEWNAVKVFTATVAHDREALGERVTAWLRSRPEVQVAEACITQSSDDSFHCLAITLFFREPEGSPLPQLAPPAPRPGRGSW